MMGRISARIRSSSSRLGCQLRKRSSIVGPPLCSLYRQVAEKDKGKETIVAVSAMSALRLDGGLGYRRGLGWRRRRGRSAPGSRRGRGPLDAELLGQGRHQARGLLGRLQQLVSGLGGQARGRDLAAHRRG